MKFYVNLNPLRNLGDVLRYRLVEFGSHFHQMVSAMVNCYSQAIIDLADHPNVLLAVLRTCLLTFRVLLATASICYRWVGRMSTNFI